MSRPILPALLSLARLTSRSPAPGPVSNALQRAIEKRISNLIGVAFRIVEIEPRNVLSASPERTFHRLRLKDVSGSEIDLHVRIQPWRNRWLDVHRLDDYLTAKGFPTPTCYGSVNDGANVAVLWEYCDGQTARSFVKASRDQIEATVRAMALISARSQDVAEHFRIPTLTRWIEPFAGRILEQEAEFDGLAPYRAGLERLASREDAMIERMQSQTLQVLNHNDLVARNTLMMADGSVRILDWDSATLGPIGASLRDFAKLEDDAEVADLYGAELRRHGLAADDQEVRFVMRAQQIFWNLHIAYRKGLTAKVVNALKVFEKTDV